MQSLDWQILHALNGLGLPWLDGPMLTLSDWRIWWWIAGLAAALAFFTRWRGAWRLALALLLAVGMADGASYWVFKPRIGRPRPCHQATDLRLPAGCGSPSGFPSNHAANGMAVTGVLACVAPFWVSATAAVLTLAVGISRVYLGVHFPTDVLAGFAFGGGVGLAIGWLFYRRKKKRDVASRKPFTALGEIS